MSLELRWPYAPMEATPAEEIPVGTGWQYEPKWDGFRCLAFRDDGEVFLQSKSGQPLTRYFPEIAEAIRGLRVREFVLDGEIAVPVQGRFSFDDLLQRIHPAESRVRRLAGERPAIYVVFDLLAAPGRTLVDQPLSERRRALEDFAAKRLVGNRTFRLSPATRDANEAGEWLASTGENLDGLMAKRLDTPYRSGERDAMLKLKRERTADCVVGGFRYAQKAKVIGSLLLGLYDHEGRLNHVGFCSALKGPERQALTPKLEALVRPPGFTGQAPGGPSRWSTNRSTEWQPLAPKLVVEVGYDHFTGGRFRHGTRFIRWRPDKAPEQCGIDQVQRSGQSPLALLEISG